jgi:hypothetical protein
MSSNVAIQALETSLSMESSTPNLGPGDRETYLQEQRSALRACVIEPVTVTARAGSWAQQYCGMSANPYRMIAVAYFNSKVGQGALNRSLQRLAELLSRRHEVQCLSRTLIQS